MRKSKRKEESIKRRLEKGMDLTHSQIAYVRNVIEPKYSNASNSTKSNVLMYLGYSYDQANDFVSTPRAKERWSVFVPYSEIEEKEDLD